MGGSGRNIPSFELFTSPDWRGTEGHIFFDYPLYRYGNLIKDIRLEFKAGQVVKATASQNEKLLQELVKQKNADKVGEYSLTDKRYSHITKFMANTLYDENFGGEWGNTHLALGTSYHEAYRGDMGTPPKGKSQPSTVGSEGTDEGAIPSVRTEEEWMALGFNESPEHTDIIATNDRLVEAHLTDGSKKVIYAKGEFQV
jgi:aminopeptidase